MIIKSAKYKTSVVKIEDIFDDGIPEFAFVGRSNVGKSSLINNLTGVKGLAKASATPGKTKMINYFDINGAFRFVDLPGYGFAMASKSTQEVWAGLLGQYLEQSQNLVTVFLLMDVRREPSEQDKQMIKFLVFNGVPFVVILTKCDKVSKSEMARMKNLIATKLAIRSDVILYSSSSSGLGKDEILKYIESRV